MGVKPLRTGKWINKIWKQYDVIDDIAFLIEKKIHNDQMKVICWIIDQIFNRRCETYGNHKDKIIEKFIGIQSKICDNIINANYNKFNRYNRTEYEHDASEGKIHYYPITDSMYNKMGLTKKVGRESKWFSIMTLHLKQFDKTWIDKNGFKLNKGLTRDNMKYILDKNNVKYNKKDTKTQLIKKYFEIPDEN